MSEHQISVSVNGDRIDGRVEAADLTRHDAEQMQRIRMVGDLGQDPAIDRFRVGQAAGLVVPQGHLHRLVDCQRLHVPVVGGQGRTSTENHHAFSQDSSHRHASSCISALNSCGAS